MGEGIVGGGGAAQIFVGGRGAAQGFVRGGGAAQGLVGGGGAAQGFVRGRGAAQGLVGGDDQLLGSVTLECGGDNITAPKLDIQTNSLESSFASLLSILRLTDDDIF